MMSKPEAIRPTPSPIICPRRRSRRYRELRNASELCNCRSMRLSLRVAILVVLALNLAAGAAGQKPSAGQAPLRKSVPRKRYCQPDGGFCFKYPSSWSVLGEVFDGNGVVLSLIHISEPTRPY